MSETMPEKQLTETAQTKPTPVSTESSSKGGTVAIIVVILVILAVIAGVVVLAFQPGGVVTQVRDIFIILMALMMFVIGIALVVLIIQLADLTNLLKNEIKPIMTSTTDTVNTLKGTVRFMSDNLTEPVIKMNQSFAGVKKIAQLLRFKK